MGKKIEFKLLNLEKAFAKLKQFLTVEKPSELERTGIIKAFEYTFELFWKSFKVKGELDGLQIASPKAALRYAMQAQIISNEEVWLSMLEMRNLGVHTYNEDEALRIYREIRDHFLEEFANALTKLRTFVPV